MHLLSISRCGQFFPRGGGGGGGCKNSGSLSASNEISVDEKNPLIATDVHMQ